MDSERPCSQCPWQFSFSRDREQRIGVALKYLTEKDSDLFLGLSESELPATYVLYYGLKRKLTYKNLDFKNLLAFDSPFRPPSLGAP